MTVFHWIGIQWDHCLIQVQCHQPGHLHTCHIQACTCLILQLVVLLCPSIIPMYGYNREENVHSGSGKYKACLLYTSLLLSDRTDKKAAKGVPRTAIKNRLRHRLYSECLFDSTYGFHLCRMYTKRSS